MTEPLKYYLLPGALKFSSKPMEITTLLGSCVSVCLWDPRLKIGGMNHYMMPLWNGTGLASPKFGNIAIEKLIKSLISLGSHHNDIVAKVFGGAAVLNSSECIFNIGERNIDIQENILKQMGINVVAKSLGGDKGRKLIFNTDTGLVKMKFIKKQIIR
ncbi:MAG: chemotaxis protein CheD [Bacteroidota bacterium]